MYLDAMHAGIGRNEREEVLPWMSGISLLIPRAFSEQGVSNLCGRP